MRVNFKQKKESSKKYTRRSLKEVLKQKKFIRIIEAHNGLTALIAEKVTHNKNKEKKVFNGIWISSLTDSAAKGKPDIEIVDLTSKLITLNDILEITNRPVIVDVDTGGKIEHFGYTVKALERIGVSAIVVEDKIGLKKNSLLGDKASQQQDSIVSFSEKIKFGKQSQLTKDFMIAARIESLILKKGIDDAIERAKNYIKAGADIIMIHSCKKDPEEILNFCALYNKLTNRVPLMVVPTTYNMIYEEELEKIGVNIVVYANHILRAAYVPMVNAAKSILENSRSYELENRADMASIQEILHLIPGTI